MLKVLVAVIALTVIGLTPTSRADAPATTSAANEPTVAVKRASITASLDGQGTFEPIDAFEGRVRLVVFQGRLTIASIARNGSAVKKGDVLLRLDQSAIKRLVTAAETEVVNAKAGYERTVADTKIAEQGDVLASRQQQDALKEAKDAVKWFENVEGPHMLKSQELQLAQVQSQVEDQQDELDQLRKMYKSEELTNATADIVVKRALRQLEMTKAISAMTKENFDKFKTWSYPITKQRVYDALTVAQQNFDLYEIAAKQTKVVRKTNLAAAAAALEAAEVKLAEYRHDHDQFSIRSPMDGLVSYGQIANGSWSGNDAKAMRVGETVNPNSTLLTVYQPGRLKVTYEVPEAKFFSVQGGQKASVSPIAFPEIRYDGAAEAPSHAPVASGGNYALTISPGSVDSRIIPGMKATVNIDVKLAEDVLVVPSTAISGEKVWVKTGGSVESRVVRIGCTDGKKTEIISGLHEGDEVLETAKTK